MTQVLGGQLALQAMLNIAPIAATILATRRADKAGVADFGTAFLVSRVPLFLFQALGVALLAEMAGLHAAGQDARIRALLRRLLTALVGVGVAATLAVFLVGDVLSDRLMGTHDLVGRSTWAALFAANAVGLIALTLSAESLARSRYARYGLSWLIGTMAAALTTALVDGLVTRVTAGYVVGMATTVVSLVLLSRWRSGSAPEPRARPETRINNFD